MTDRDLRNLLAILDEIEPAPSDLVERVWRDVESLLVEEIEGSARDEGPAPPVVSIEQFEREASRRRRSRRGGVWLAVAAVLLVVAFVVSMDRFGSEPDDLAVSDAPVSADPTDSPPDTIEGACAAFRDTTVELTPPGDETALADPAAVGTWVDALGTLIADIDRIGLAEGTDDQILTLQLLRTALRSSELRLADGDLDGAATALANAARHRESLGAADAPLSGCLEPAG